MKYFAAMIILSGIGLGANFERHLKDEVARFEDEIDDNLNSESETQQKGIEKLPHFIFILLDDMGFNHVSWNNDDMVTPNLQALADEGVILDYNYVHPVCSPSRGSLLSGKFAMNIGLQHEAIGFQAPVCLDLSQRILPEYLKETGYSTYMVGKWHLGFCNVECTPLYRGFDKFNGFYQAFVDYFNQTTGHPGHLGYDLRDGLDVDRVNNGTFTTELFTTQAVDMISNHDPNTPMFLYLSHEAPHTPQNGALPKFLDLYPDEADEIRKQTKAMVSSADYSIGRVVQALKEKGMYENSVIMFSSDNGGELNHGDNYPLRGAKSSVFEGGTRVPGMFHSPLATVKGLRRQGMFHIVDWFATIMSMVGANTSGLDGVDQTDMLFHGGESARDEIVYNIDNDFPQTTGAYGIRVGDYKLIKGFPGMYDGWEQYGGVGETDDLDYLSQGRQLRRSGTAEELPRLSVDRNYLYQYISKVQNYYQLFNIADDPEERLNLASMMPNKVAELEARMDDLAAGAAKVNVEDFLDIPEGSPNNFGGIWESGWC